MTIGVVKAPRMRAARNQRRAINRRPATITMAISHVSTSHPREMVRCWSRKLMNTSASTPAVLALAMRTYS